jgi:hypothetical protein
MGTSVEMIDRTYGHLVKGSEEATIARMNARSQRLGQAWVTSEGAAGHALGAKALLITGKRTMGLEPTTPGLGSRPRSPLRFPGCLASV